MLDPSAISQIDTLLERLTALRAGYLDELDFDLDARLGSPAGASLAADIANISSGITQADILSDANPFAGADIAAIKAYVDSLETRLTAARAGYLDELAAANIPADVDTLLTRLSAARAGYLDELDFDLDARLGSPAGASLAADLVTIAAYVDELETRLTAARAGYLDELDFDLDARLGSPAGASLAADLATIAGYVDSLETRLTATRAGYLDELAAANIPADVDTLKNRTAREALFKDQWCQTPIASQAITNSAADLSFSDVVFSSGFLPSGAVVQAVYLMFKWRKQVDSSGSANAINGSSKTIRVKKTSGSWGTDDVVGITFADNQIHTAGNATEGGDMIIGSHDISGEVDDIDNETYNVRSEQTNRSDALVVDADGLTLYDIYTGLRVYYTLG